MSGGLKKILKTLFITYAVFYPVFVYYFLVVKKVSIRYFSLFVIAFALIAFISRTSSKGEGKKEASFLRNTALLLAVGLICLFTNSALVLKSYPLLMNLMFLAAFGSTCFFPPNMIFRFATMQDKTIKGSLGEKKVEAYCQKVTIAWCIFFVFNGCAAAWTIFSGSDAVWSLYNGGISYILIGVFFTGELIVRKMVQRNTPKAAALSAIKNNSRPLCAVVCYDGIYSDDRIKTWGDFLEGTSALRAFITSINSDKWLLYCDDSWLFLLSFASLLQCKKEILLSANISPVYLEEIRADGGSCAPFLTDLIFAQGEKPKNTFSVSEILEQGLQSTAAGGGEEAPQISADETSIVMYTSGSTGKPKLVKQRLTEFENDNKFVLSKWGEEFLKRKLCSTVNQHHIYGLLFGVLLPFTAGVPFRRKRIEFPEEFEKLTDSEYMIITVPAFLKRAVEIEALGLNLKSPWIFTSGGVLNPPTAKKTSEIFGFWPVEIYGSTETSGIAYRQSCKGLEWMPFDNAQISKNDEGCLVIRSPYIKDPAGFVTADMVEMLDDGRFLLNGRADSVVKIEEKRISLVEIEARILQSGLASQTCVISLEDSSDSRRRQYLAAAVVFNEKGKERFAGKEKSEINKFWREYLIQFFENIVIPKKWRYLEKFPQDAQGKKKREDIELLFLNEREAAQMSAFAGLEKETVIEKTDNSISLEFSVPETCYYFDGHFPAFKVLPAVAQMEIIVRFASRYLGTDISLCEIRKAKFSNIVRPFTPLLLKLSKDGNTITFNIISPDGSINYSAGTVVAGIK